MRMSSWEGIGVPRIDRRCLSKALLAIPLALALHCFELISQPEAVRSMELFLGKVFGRLTLNNDGIYLLAIENLAFVLVFNLLYATCISEHFRYSCVYVFSRQRSRRAWYFRRVGELVLYAVLYLLLYLVCVLLVCLRRSTLPLEAGDWGKFAVVFLFSLSIVMDTTLAINLLAMRWGVTVSFFLVQGVLSSLILLAIWTSNIPWMVQINPISCMNLFDQGAGAQVWMAAYHVLLFAAVLFGGARYVARYDVAMFDAERN